VSARVRASALSGSVVAFVRRSSVVVSALEAGDDADSREDEQRRPASVVPFRMARCHPSMMALASSTRRADQTGPPDLSIIG